ncbi:MAG: SDR family NAD(P)-dependent oxidoreductase, partial [Pseudomonadota bacterium]
MLDLTGRVAIVTGAGSVGPGWGNGRATAVLLARQGAAVFLIDIVEAAVEETRKRIEAEGKLCAVHLCDMLKAAEVERMVQACVDRFKRIDILVNNVGGSEP